MRALSLWQPWASLVAIGAKRIETRSWPPPDWLLEQRIAIHAAKRWTAAEQLIACSDLFDFCLKVAGYDKPTVDRGLPFGAIVATARLDNVFRTDLFQVDAELEMGEELMDGQHWIISPQEYAFGDYSPDRFAWMLSEVQILPEPIPYRGGQRLFKVAL